MATAKQAQVTTYENWIDELIVIATMTPMGNPASQYCGWSQPTIFWGGSGLGKSDIVKRSALMVGNPYEVLFPGQRQPEDFSGVLTPNPKSATGVSIECLLPAVRRLNELGGGLLFIDEASNAPPAVQGAMLGMLLDRNVGDTKLAPGIRILLAANPPDIAAGGYTFEPPTANRLAHFNLGPPSWDRWNHWYMTEDDEIAVEQRYTEQMIRDGWPTVYPHIKGFISGFLQSHTALMYSQPKAQDPKGGLPWPSPRTWVKAGRCMATRKILGLPEELDDIVVAGLVGEAPALEFATWRHDADLPKPEDVLDGKWQLDRHLNRIDILHAVLGSAVSYVGSKRDETAKQEAGVKIWQLFKKFQLANQTDLIMDPMKIVVTNYGMGMTGKASDAIRRAAAEVMNQLSKSAHARFV